MKAIRFALLAFIMGFSTLSAMKSVEEEYQDILRRKQEQEEMLRKKQEQEDILKKIAEIQKAVPAKGAPQPEMMRIPIKPAEIPAIKPAAVPAPASVVKKAPEAAEILERKKGIQNLII